MPLTGDGYFAGEYPGGTTTVEGAPVSATVLVYQRDSGQLVAQTESSQSGEWIVTGVDLSKAHDIVGRKEGFNDVIVSNVTPTSMVDITYSGAVVENETFTGAEGCIEVVGGIPPYSVAAETPLPAGLFPVMSGRNLIIDGTTGADEVASFDVKVTSSNGAEKIIPLQLVVGFKAPQNFKAETVVVNGVFSVVLTWETTNSTQQVKVYRSETPIDMDDLPEPIATLSGTSTTYTDDDVIDDDVFYYMAASVCESFTLYSDGVRKAVNGGDPHWDKVVALLHFDGDLTDETGRIWSSVGASTFSNTGLARSPALAGATTTPFSADMNLLNHDFTIEFWVMADSWWTWASDLRGNPPMAFGNMAPEGTSNHWSLGPTRSGRLALYAYNGGDNVYLTSTREIPLGILTHVSVMRQGDEILMSIGGVVEVVGTVGSIVLGSTNPFTVGRYNKVTRVGVQDELRITKGVARYTENFTPPAEPFPNF